jgi:ABC-2 type transport system permease protein
MRGSVTRRLILKDWRLQRLQVILCMIGGAIALAVGQLGGETSMVVGGTWFFVALICVGCMLPVSTIVNERKKHNLPFLMSLPISPFQYSTAKLVSTVGIFVVPWLALLIAAALLVETSGTIPHGTIPLILILATLPLVGFCFITGTALVSESEGWSIAATVVCNSSYGLTWYFMTRIPGLMTEAKGPVAVWSPTALGILAVEFALIALSLGLSFYLQSRKRDFI